MIAFTNEMGNQIALDVTASRDTVTIRMVGPDSTGNWEITRIEAAKLVGELYKALKGKSDALQI